MILIEITLWPGIQVLCSLMRTIGKAAISEKFPCCNKQFIKCRIRTYTWPNRSWSPACLQLISTMSKFASDERTPSWLTRYEDQGAVLGEKCSKTEIIPSVWHSMFFTSFATPPSILTQNVSEMKEIEVMTHRRESRLFRLPKEFNSPTFLLKFKKDTT